MIKSLLRGLMLGVGIMVGIGLTGVFAFGYLAQQGAQSLGEAMEKEFRLPQETAIIDDSGDHNAPNTEDYSDCVAYKVTSDGIPFEEAENVCRTK